MTKARAFTLALAVVASGAHASPYDALWSEFERRCLTPFEAFDAPVVADLPAVAGRADTYQLANGAVLVLGGETPDASRSCTVKGIGLRKGYRGWVAQSRESGTYRETDIPGQWMSHEWIEPRIVVEKSPVAIRVMESFLES